MISYLARVRHGLHSWIEAYSLYVLITRSRMLRKLVFVFVFFFYFTEETVINRELTQARTIFSEALS